MRLTTAATVLLSTAIPASTREVTMASQLTDVSNHAYLHETTNHDNVHALAAKHPNIQTATQALSMMVLAQIQAKTEGGVLHNEKSFQENEDRTKECDPSSEDPDIGILSCVENQHCMASKHSKLGGFCATAADSRELLSFGQFSSILSSLPCYNSTFPYKCDCSKFDITSFSGSVNCLYQSYTCIGCPEYCGSVNFSVTFAAGAKVSEYTYCFDLKKPYGLTFCEAQYKGSYACKLTANGVSCNSCTNNFSAFDCSNVAHGYSSTTSIYPVRVLKQMNTLASNATCAPGKSPSGNGPSAAPAKSSPTKASGVNGQYGLVGMRMLAFASLGSLLVAHFTMWWYSFFAVYWHFRLIHDSGFLGFYLSPVSSWSNQSRPGSFQCLE